MQTFKKALLSIILFLALTLSLLAVIITPYLHSHLDPDQDKDTRDALSGSVTHLIVGASQAKCSIVPKVLDSELDCVSYNLSTTLMPMSARYIMLRTELERNPVDTVFLEISFDTLQSKASSGNGWGEAIMFARTGSWSEGLKYLFGYTGTDQLLDILSRAATKGISAWKDKLLTGRIPDNVNSEAKGFYATASNDVSYSKELFTEKFHTKHRMTGFRDENLKMLKEMINLCHEHGVNVIIGIVPYSEANLFIYDDLDLFDEWMREFAESNGCAFIDFNLLKARSMVFSDTSSFYDGSHMCKDGAETFTVYYASVIENLLSGQDISDEFYTDYSGLLSNSQYSDLIS